MNNMAYRQTQVARHFEAEAMPSPELASFLYDAVKADGSAIVPVALPGLKTLGYYPGQEFELEAEGTTDIIFVDAKQPLKVEVGHNRELGLDNLDHGWWQYDSTKLSLNGLSESLRILPNVQADPTGRSRLRMKYGEYEIAGRVARGYERHEIVDTSFSIADIEALQTHLMAAALVGWDAVSGINMRYVIRDTTIDRFSNVSSRLPKAVIGAANEAWGVNFDPELPSRYDPLRESIKQLQGEYHTAGWL